MAGDFWDYGNNAWGSYAWGSYTATTGTITITNPSVQYFGQYQGPPSPPSTEPTMAKQSDVFLYDGDGKYLQTCDDLKEAEREAKRLAAKTEDEIRIVRCVKVVRPKRVEIETEDV